MCKIIQHAKVKHAASAATLHRLEMPVKHILSPRLKEINRDHKNRGNAHSGSPSA